jgi:surfactin synthase thioesterase subunit
MIALPFAGGSASAYAAWGDRLPADVELLAVQLPGRAERTFEPLVTSMEQLLDALLPDLEPEFEPPYVLLGHSNGALIATALLQRIVASSLPAPLAMILSGKTSPTRPHPQPAPSELSDVDLLEWLRALGGTPRELLDDDELMRLILPVVRADCAIGESFRLDANSRAFSNMPALIMAGTHDAAASIEDVFAWRDIFGDAGVTSSCAGNHFFLHENPQALTHINAFLAGLAWESAGSTRQRDVG